MAYIFITKENNNKDEFFPLDMVDLIRTRKEVFDRFELDWGNDSFREEYPIDEKKATVGNFIKFLENKIPSFEEQEEKFTQYPLKLVKENILPFLNKFDKNFLVVLITENKL